MPKATPKAAPGFRARTMPQEWLGVARGPRHTVAVVATEHEYHSLDGTYQIAGDGPRGARVVMDLRGEEWRRFMAAMARAELSPLLAARRPSLAPPADAREGWLRLLREIAQALREGGMGDDLILAAALGGGED